MATFTGGETITGVTSAEGTTGGSQTLYFAPVGKYAHVHIHLIKNNNASSRNLVVGSVSGAGGYTTAMATTTELGSGSASPLLPELIDIVLASGEQITINGSTVYYYIVAKEFNNP